MDSLVSLNPNFIDQKDFYKTLVSYSVVYKFTPSDKSLKQAEEMGVLQNMILPNVKTALVQS